MLKEYSGLLINLEDCLSIAFSHRRWWFGRPQYSIEIINNKKCKEFFWFTDENYRNKILSEILKDFKK